MQYGVSVPLIHSLNHGKEKKSKVEIDISIFQSKHKRLNQVGPVLGVPQLLTWGEDPAYVYS